MRTIKKLFLLTLAMTLLFPASFVGQVHAAATLTNLSDTMSSMTAAVGSTHIIDFKVTSTNAITSFVLTASSNWGSQPTAGWSGKDVTTSTAFTGVSVVATNATTFTINITSFTPASGDVLEIDSPSITNWAAGTYTETVNTGTETGSLAVLILTNTTDNQLSVTATDSPSISFSVSGGPLTMPSGGGNMLLNNATGNESGQGTVTISTNAANGAAITVKDANAGIKITGYTINSVGAGAAATLAAEGYGMGCPAPGTGTVDAQYLSTYAAAKVGALATTVHNMWSTNTSFASAVTLNPYFNAYITGTTPAGTYTDTITYIATATF